jgi:16S rRNA G966 N2-methylase RsmD
MNRKSSRRPQVDKIFRDEADIAADAKENAIYEEESSEMSDHVDDMDAEEFELGARVSKKKVGRVGKRNANDKTADTNADELEEREDEADDTVFIDNLPKEIEPLRSMIEDVNFHIRDLERQFFEEEDSEVEMELKQNLSIKEHNQQLEQLKEKSHIQQFWTIPMSENVTDLEFDRLAQTQKKNGGRLFDVITCDPPWQLSSANPTRGVAIAYETLNDNQILNIPFNKL